jgi:hypothetical protein
VYVANRYVHLSLERLGFESSFFSVESVANGKKGWCPKSDENAEPFSMGSVGSFVAVPNENASGDGKEPGSVRNRRSETG